MAQGLMVSSLGTSNAENSLCEKESLFCSLRGKRLKGGGAVWGGDISGAVELDKPPSQPFFVLSRNAPLQKRTEDLDKYYEDILLFHHNCLNCLLL